MKELTAERRRKWISTGSREDLMDKILENDRVCGECSFLESQQPVGINTALTGSQL